MDIITLALAKKYAKNLVASIAEAGFSPKIVGALPTENISDHTLYLVPASDGITNNGYLEYIYINNAWECVGSTVIDFSMIGDVSQLTTEDKTTLVAAINEVFAKSETAINETKTYVNNQINNINKTIEETTSSINGQINSLNENVNSRVFQGNATVFGNLTEKEQQSFDIAIVEPLAKLNEEELSLVDSMVGGEATPTVVDLSENEIHKTLNNIIGGE